jgi:hypothetical protein
MSTKRGSSVGSKAKGKSQKKQGDQPSTGSMSDKRQEPTPSHLDRGNGSEFANSVKTVMEQTKNLKGSANSFLGVDKQLLDPKQFADTLSDKK